MRASYQVSVQEVGVKGQSRASGFVSIGKAKMQKVDGGEIEVDLNANVKTQYFDEYTGEPPPNLLVRGGDRRNVVLLREGGLDSRRVGRHEIIQGFDLCAHEVGAIQQG